MCAAVVAYLVIGAVAGAQVAPASFGPAPGEAFEWPDVRDLFTGEAVVIQAPSVVIVSSLTPCDNCRLPIALAESWAGRYGDLQVVLVTRHTGDPDAMRQELDRHLARSNVAIVADQGAVANALGFNIHPIIFLVSEGAVVRIRQTGFDLRRLIALDHLVSLANERRWSELDALGFGTAGHGGPSGLLAAWGVEPGSRATVAVIHSEACIHCRRLGSQGLDLILNDFASRYPDTQFVLLEVEGAVDYSSQAEAFSATFELTDDAWLYDAAATAVVDEDAVRAFDSTRLSSEIALVEIAPGGQGDPIRLNGIGVLPNIWVFDDQGRFVGPEPYWVGPYDAGGLINTLDALMAD